ncbi:MAG: hypothetical protein IT177_20350 [Acidobacteria bacterium]|nr:hypothetical protein [Acidobacteriota bacterium]
MFRRAVPILGGLLVLFHAWLFGSQWWDGQLAEPGLTFRWLIAAGLVTALAGLRRRGVSIFHGRKAVAIWLLAALLHGPAMSARADHPESPALPEAATVLVQLTALSTALGLGLLLMAALSGRSRARTWRVSWLAPSCLACAFESRRAFRFAPRPPPFAPSLVCS